VVDWDACLTDARPLKLSGVVFRLVESQEQVATNQLVSSLERQAVLEDMLEATKPRLRKGTESLHCLLATPFRYPPLKHGSRFGTRSEPSLFYGSLETRTLLAEAAYYRFVFWHGMTRPPASKLDTQHTLFGAEYRTVSGLRLQNPPFAAHRDALASPSDYHASQALGSRMRAAGIEARHRDLAAGAVIKPGDEGKQSSLARAIHPQQGSEGAASHGEGHAFQRLNRAEAVADIRHHQRRR